MNAEERETSWQVDFSNKAGKQIEKLPPDMRDAVYLLKHYLEQDGPERKEWRNYSLITNIKTKDVHHCHLNNNRPRYVVVWRVLDREKQIIKIVYAGPHGSVNYSRF